jgi:hypothetical protein
MYQRELLVLHATNERSSSKESPTATFGLLQSPISHRPRRSHPSHPPPSNCAMSSQLSIHCRSRRSHCYRHLRMAGSVARYMKTDPYRLPLLGEPWCSQRHLACLHARSPNFRPRLSRLVHCLLLPWNKSTYCTVWNACGVTT